MIVDLVSTGNTLHANDLVAVEDIMPITSRLIVNPGALKLKRAADAAADRRARARRRTPQPRRDAMPTLSLRRLDTADPGFDAALDALIAFESAQDPAIDAAVAAIIDDVRARGDDAVLEYTRRFDRLRRAVGRGARDRRPPIARRVRMRFPPRSATRSTQAAARVRRYHERQKAGGWSFTRAPTAPSSASAITPLDRVGIYVPGGKAAYPSSVLMNAMPAHVAGVPRDRHGRCRRRTACAIRWCSPPRISPA